MLVREIMTPHPSVCTADTPIPDVARLMVHEDCGAIPVVRTIEDRHVIGIVTDRDITCRIVAADHAPAEKRAGDCMSHPVATVNQNDTLDRCIEVLEQNQVRRAVVVDDDNRCCGMVSQADIARNAPLQETGEVVKELSRGA